MIRCAEAVQQQNGSPIRCEKEHGHEGLHEYVDLAARSIYEWGFIDPKVFSPAPERPYTVKKWRKPRRKRK